MSGNQFCELVVVRHGQTLANRTGVLQGQSQAADTALDEVGLAQAEAVAERLRGEPFDAFYSSDLGRALQTARILAKYHPDLEIRPESGLREWDLGILQGRKYTDLNRDFPEIMASFRKNADNVVVPGGETQKEFQARVSACLDRLAAEHPGGRLLLVSHGGAIQCMLTHVTGPLASGNVRSLSANAGISVFRRLPAGWQLVAWNETAHLRNLSQHETLLY